MRVDVRGDIISNDNKWIYDYLELDGTCPRDVLTAIQNASAEPLDVYINSPGGDVVAGSEIYAAIQEYQGEVKIHIVGQACSAASVIACAGYCDMVRTGLFMYHNVSGTCRGDHHAMSKGVEILQTANRAIAAAYREKTGKTEAELLQEMDAETWITAEEAVKMGFVDAIAESKNLKLTASCAGTLPPQVIDKVRNIVKGPLKSQKDAEFLKAQINILKLKMEERT